jgi:hypothetical protein
MASSKRPKMIKIQLSDAVKNPVRFKLGESEIPVGPEPVDVTDETAKAIETQYPGWTQRVPAKGQTPIGTENK